jgi:Putative auto-transporter adhesin, head GIN domain
MFAHSQMQPRALCHKLIWAVGITLLLLPGTIQAKERKLLISSFQDIIIEGDLIVSVMTGKSPSAIASGDRDAIDSLRLSQSGNKLTLSQKNAGSGNSRMPNSTPLTITITNRALRDVTIRGNGQLTVNAIRQPGNSRIRLLGSGQVMIDSVAIGNMDVSIAGNGTVTIGSGAVRDARVSIDGSGSYNAPGTQHKKLILSQNGGAETNADVLEYADISNDGAGNVTITGKGKCNILRKGSGSISCAHFEKSK